MNCPACSSQLSVLKAGQVELEVCDGGCAGVWFDPNELQHLDEPKEFEASPLKRLRKGSTESSKDIRSCPKCSDEVMAKLWIDPANRIRVDQCFNCGGVWFDQGEVEQLAHQYEDSAARAAAVDSYAAACLEGHKKAVAALGREKLAQLQEETDTLLEAFLYFFRRML